jgi:hypothetical protein
VQGDVTGLVALDFKLRLVGGGTANVAFVVDVPSVHFDDYSAHARAKLPNSVPEQIKRFATGSEAARLDQERVGDVA